MLSASNYGHFSSAKEFRSQCHIFRFGNIHRKPADANVQEGHFLKITLNLFLTLSDDGECPTFFDSLRNYCFRCFLRRIMVIFRQQKNLGVFFYCRVPNRVANETV